FSGKLITPTTWRPTSSSGAYSCAICALVFISPCGPKSTHTLKAGLRASGNASTRVTVPATISTFSKSDQLIGAAGTSATSGRAGIAFEPDLHPTEIDADARGLWIRPGIGQGALRGILHHRELQHRHVAVAIGQSLQRQRIAGRLPIAPCQRR